MFADVTILPYLDFTTCTTKETKLRNPSLTPAPQHFFYLKISWLYALCLPYFIRGNLSAFFVILNPPHPSLSLFLRFAGRNRWTPLKRPPSRSNFYQPSLLSATLLDVLIFQTGRHPRHSPASTDSQPTRRFSSKEWIRDGSECPLVFHLCREAEGGSRTDIHQRGLTTRKHTSTAYSWMVMASGTFSPPGASGAIAISLLMPLDSSL